MSNEGKNIVQSKKMLYEKSQKGGLGESVRRSTQRHMFPRNVCPVSYCLQVYYIAGRIGSFEAQNSFENAIKLISVKVIENSRWCQGGVHKVSLLLCTQCFSNVLAIGLQYTYVVVVASSFTKKISGLTVWRRIKNRSTSDTNRFWPIFSIKVATLLSQFTLWSITLGHQK